MASDMETRITKIVTGTGPSPRSMAKGAVAAIIEPTISSV